MTVRKTTPYADLKTPKKPKGPKERFEELKDEGLRGYVRSLPCLACQRLGMEQRGPTECAHVTTKGAAGGDWDNMVPLCSFHHSAQHFYGIPHLEFVIKAKLKPYARKVTALYVAFKKHG